MEKSGKKKAFKPNSHKKGAKQPKAPFKSRDTPSPYARIRQEELLRLRQKRLEEAKIRETQEALSHLENLRNSILHSFNHMNATLSSIMSSHLSGSSTNTNYQPDFFEFLDDDDFETSDDDEDLEDDFDYRFAGIGPAGRSSQRLEDEYVFISQDSKGNPMEKRMKARDEVPFQIELDIKGFDPEDILITSTENRMTISMTKDKIKDFRSKLTAKGKKSKIFGIHCPSVEAVDKLDIRYPKNGILVIQGPKPTI